MRLLAPDEAYWPAYRATLETGRASGNLAFDAQIAALCATHGARLLTADRDFLRFDVEVERLTP